MDKRVLRESDRGHSDHSDDDQDELRSESERNERSGREGDVKIPAQADGSEKKKARKTPKKVNLC